MVYDSKASTVAICPPLLPQKDQLLAVGHDIYALHTTCSFVRIGSTVSFYPSSMEKLGPAPRRCDRGEWRWENLPPPQSKLRGTALCSALHPSGFGFFLSLDHTGTFSFNTGGLAWTWLGDWLLPFRDEAYFVRELDVSAGLCGQKIGDIVMCHVISPNVLRPAPPS
jgi:hypothetical protein